MGFSIFVAHPSELLTDHRPHGDGLVAYGFVRALAERGHELHVAAQRVELRGRLPPNLHVYPLGAEVLPEPLSRLEYMRRMRVLFKKLRRGITFDLIHQLNPVTAGLTLALPDVHLPIVLGPYVPPWPRLSSARPALAGCVEKLAAAVHAAQQRRAAVVLLSTPAATARLAHPQGRLRVRELSPGIDEKTWNPGTHRELGQRILFLGHLESRKGIFVLLEAYARVLLELPGAQLRVAGDGVEADAVRDCVQKSPALRSVELLGPVPREQVPELMRSCSVCCLPSLGEPFGMTALEAMACGMPLVVTDAGGLRYLVDDEGGRRVPPGDPDALAAALCEVLGAPELGRNMGHHNRALIEKRYTWTSVVERLEDAYGEAIAVFRTR
jgi:glycosyltransferase involved in cell wall biosynthesis